MVLSECTTGPEGLQALAILQAKISLKTGGLGCFQNWLYLDHQIRSNFEGAPGQIRCSQWSQANVLTGPEGLQAKNSKSVTHLFMNNEKGVLGGTSTRRNCLHWGNYTRITHEDYLFMSVIKYKILSLLAWSPSGPVRTFT